MEILYSGFWKETIERRYKEGLSKFVNNEILAFGYFKVGPLIHIIVGDSTNPNFYPTFEVKVIKRTGDKKIIQNKAGNIIEIFSNNKSSILNFIDFPVKNIDDFNKIKWRFSIDNKRIENAPCNKFDFLIHLTKLMNWPLNISFCSLFGTGRHLMGFENYLYAFYDGPELIHLINREWLKLCKFCIYKISKITDISHINFWEDCVITKGQ